MSRGSPARAVAIALVILLAAVAALARPAGTSEGSVPPEGSGGLPTVPATPTADVAGTAKAIADGISESGGVHPLIPGLGQARVRTDKNCYLPGQIVTFTLKNVGSGPLAWDSMPDFEVENATVGIVRMIKSFQRGNFHMDPGGTVSWTWDQRWDAWDPDGVPIHKGEYVPKALYTVNIMVESGYPLPEVSTVASARFSIGDCMARISAGDDIVAGEGETFQFHPDIEITGNAVVNSVTWDLNPAVDTNGDGNATNDMDLLGTNPSYAFGDDGIYNVTMNLRGFGTISGMDRVSQDVVFAIDSSTSMQSSDPFDLRKVATKAYVDRMVPNDRGAVVDFDSVARIVNDHHLSGDYSQIKEDIDTVDSEGDVFLASGLLLSLWELRDYGDPTHKWIVIFLSAAQSENPRDSLYIPRAITLAQDLGVPIYTIGLNIVDPAVTALMRSIALQTGGRYFPAATAGNLYKIYDDIQSETNTTQGAYFTVSDSLSVTVQNVPPDVSLESAVPVNVTLRVAGEKYHDVTMVLYRNGAEAARATVLRVPGSPDNQSASVAVVVAIEDTYDLRVEYAPDDDPSGAHGANPAWIILTPEGGAQVWLHHTFNGEQPDTWVWELNDLEGLFLGRSVSLNAHITDPGTDDVTVVWDWGDGTVETRAWFNDGVGPDPYPSPWGTPVDLTAFFEHRYVASGSYTITVTAADDDGGTTVLSFTLTVA